MIPNLKTVLTPNAPQPIGPYSQAIQAQGFLFCSGQIPLDPVNGQMVGETPREQAEVVLKNLESVLRAGGSALDRVVKVTIFLTDMSFFAEVNEVYSQFFKNHAPARSTIAVKELPKKALVEIEAIAIAG